MSEDSPTWRNILSVEDFRSIADTRSLVSIAIQSQYSHAERIGRLAALFRAELDACPQLDSFFKYILDPSTAAGVWLTVWGDRVGASRYLKVNGSYQRLDDDFFRELIFFRALVNISAATASATNGLLSRLTGAQVFVVDRQDMTASVIMVGAVADLQLSVLANYGLLNRPGGVLMDVFVYYPDDNILGFHGSELKAFNEGVFNSSVSIDISAYV